MGMINFIDDRGIVKVEIEAGYGTVELEMYDGITYEQEKEYDNRFGEIKQKLESAILKDSKLKKAVLEMEGKTDEENAKMFADQDGGLDAFVEIGIGNMREMEDVKMFLLVKSWNIGNLELSEDNFFKVCGKYILDIKKKYQDALVEKKKKNDEPIKGEIITEKLSNEKK